MKKIRQESDLHELLQRSKKKEQDSLRIKAALETVSANRIGNKEHCRTTDPKRMKDYCQRSFEDFQEAEACNNEEFFCFTCCDNEFG